MTAKVVAMLFQEDGTYERSSATTGAGVISTQSFTGRECQRLCDYMWESLGIKAHVNNCKGSPDTRGTATIRIDTKDFPHFRAVILPYVSECFKSKLDGEGRPPKQKGGAPKKGTGQMAKAIATFPDEALAAWFSVSGASETSGGVKLSIREPDRVEAQRVADFLRAGYGLECKVQTERGFFFLSLGKSKVDALITRINPHMYPSLWYKLGIGKKGAANPELSTRDMRSRGEKARGETQSKG